MQSSSDHWPEKCPGNRLFDALFELVVRFILWTCYCKFSSWQSYKYRFLDKPLNYFKTPLKDPSIPEEKQANLEIRGFLKLQ